MSLKLVVFDVDGTLVDSQAEILGAMAAAFTEHGLAVPQREAVLEIVGLSLPVAMAELVPEADPALQGVLVESYKRSYAAQRRAGATGPLYPGMRALLDQLTQRDHLLMGLATGKSRRGLTGLIDHHDLGGLFVTQHCADDHPSKPHPSMLWAALSDAGVTPEDAVMIGDTRYDMEMGRAAGMATIGVTWGYHGPEALDAAHVLAGTAADLEQAIFQVLGDRS